uniref:Uncharacterized protein n=1 Tax=Solanum lycopersicum TaxID=4081 RepID=A0A3Q7GND6_SOLLC
MDLEMTRHHEVKRKKCDGFPYLRVGFTGCQREFWFLALTTNTLACYFSSFKLEVKSPASKRLRTIINIAQQILSSVSCKL